MRRKLEHILFYKHTICDIYFRIFEKFIFTRNYRFFIRNCIFCEYKRIIAKYKLSIIKIRILFINKSKIRNIVSLVFLNFLQKAINFQLCLYNLFDFAFEISSSKITYNFCRRALTY